MTAVAQRSETYVVAWDGRTVTRPMPRKYSAEDYDLAERMLAAGATYAQLGAVFGVSGDAAEQAMRRAGLRSVNPRGRPSPKRGPIDV